MHLSNEQVRESKNSFIQRDVVIPFAYLRKLCVSIFTDKHNCQVCVIKINGFRNKCGDYVCVWLVHFFLFSRPAFCCTLPRFKVNLQIQNVYNPAHAELLRKSLFICTSAKCQLSSSGFCLSEAILSYS